VWDLRGATCEMLDGKERCFTEDTQGREMCPEFVTSEYLAWPKPGVAPYECGHEMTHQYYCTIQCQQGNSVVRWWPQNVQWCYSEENYGNCPSRQPVVPKAKFAVKPWSEPTPSLTPCQAAAAAGVKPPGKVKGLSVGVLTHEATNLRYSLKTYDVSAGWLRVGRVVYGVGARACLEPISLTTSAGLHIPPAYPRTRSLAFTHRRRTACLRSWRSSSCTSTTAARRWRTSSSRTWTSTRA
jgi:hypothetical protein